MKKFNDSPFSLAEQITEKTSSKEIEAIICECDTIEINNFASSIAEFIQICETPLTIGLQGDWGTGKTSLMNVIKTHLTDKKFHKIDINTWHYSMFRQDEYLGIIIIKSLVEELAKRFEKKDSSVAGAMKKLGSFIGSGIQKAISIGTSYEVVGNFSIDSVKEKLSGNDNSIEVENLSAILLQFKQEFTKLIQDNIVAKNERVFFFVDDLDRIRPIKAIEVLETLKNFMDVDGCVFIFAVDYEIVQLGIAEKFGKDIQKTSGKSFFDKIIQLPFSMPTSSYNIERFLVDLLQHTHFYTFDRTRTIKEKKVTPEGITLTEDIEFAEEEVVVEKNTSKEEQIKKQQEKQNEKVQSDKDFFVNITEVSIGRNPRSIKRAINYVCLLERIRSKNATKQTMRTQPQAKLLYAVVCMQIAWPELFDYFILKPTSETIKNLENWDFLDRLPHAQRLFERVRNKDEVKENISAYFDTLYDILDTDDKDGVITDKELEPLLKILQLVKLTSKEIITKNENPLNIFKKKLIDNSSKTPTIVNFFENIYSKSYWSNNDEIEYKKAGERYFTIVWNRKQIGSLITLKTKPFLLRIKETKENIFKHIPKNSDELILKIVKDLDKGNTLTGIGDTELDCKDLLNLNDNSRAISILNSIFNAITKLY